MNIPDSLKAMVKEQEPKLKHRKYSDFWANWSYEVTASDAEHYGDSDWTPFIGKTIVANGMWNDMGGSEVYDWEVYQREEVRSEIQKDFDALMSHLNGEDNELAQQFAAKYCKADSQLVKVTHE